MRRLLTMLLVPSVVVAAPSLRLALPLGRTAYQTNEVVDVSVIRTDTAPLPAGELTLACGGLSFRFGLPAAESPAVEHLRLDARWLRPGDYTLVATAHGARAEQALSIHSHLRQSTYRLIGWGSRVPAEQCAVLGEDSLGFNLLYAAVPGDASVRGGLDFTGCCVMSGGHQMDLRMACDWSDPAVLGGARARAVRAALQWRTCGNLLGIHCYDEPGLTWGPDPATGQNTPHAVAAQHDAWRAAYGSEVPAPGSLADPAAAERWRQWARWKLGFMEAAWRDTQSAISDVRPGLLTLTQSQYAWTAFTDGYYANVTRGLPVASGHGGYDDMGPATFTPTYYLEFARARDRSRPCWYLPTWYASTPPEAYRLEQYLAFSSGIQGLATPPDMQVHEPAKTPQAEAIAEVNRVAARLGTIFTTMPPTHHPVDVLYSLTHLVEAQIADPTMCYAHNDAHGRALSHVYFATKLLRQPIEPVVEEDIVDGTLAAQCRAVILPAVTHLDPRVVTALERFAAGGGLVLTVAGSSVPIRGAVDLGAMPRLPDQDKVDELTRVQKWAEMAPYLTVGKQFQAAQPLAEALRAQLARKGIAPVFTCDQPGIVGARHAAGDIEYLFAINATPDLTRPERNAVAATNAVLGTEPDPRPTYDAVRGGLAALAGRHTFGPGQMRVWARVARPIGGLSIGPVEVRADSTNAAAPRVAGLSVALVDTTGGVLSGSAPLRVRLLDPAGAARYDLYRATDRGWLRLDLPLAANEPPGTWRVEVEDLLANTVAKRTFIVAAWPTPGAVAGRVRRALLLDDDREHIRALVQNQRQMLIAVGAGGQAAGERLAAALARWKVRANVVPAADLNRPRELSEAEARTFCGLDYASQGQIKPGRDNSPLLVGFDVDRPVLLVGTPEGNPLLAALVHHKVLPYAPSAELLGHGRGMVAWQRDVLGQGIESAALIGYDEAGLAEAVGTFAEAAAGMAPLTPLEPADVAEVVGPPALVAAPEPRVLWSVTLPDRVTRLLTVGDAVVAYSADGSISLVGAGGRLGTAPPLGPVPPRAAAPTEPRLADHLLKLAATRGDRTAVAYWGGLLRVVDGRGQLVASRLMPQDIGDLTWLGDTLVVGLADGRVVALRP